MIPEKKQSVIIVAGGKGLRAGGELPKQFQPIGGEPMLTHTIKAFYDYDYRIRIVVVLPEEAQLLWSQLCEEHRFSVPHTVVPGGETRFHSVKNGLEEISADEIVGVHDGARPFVTSGLIGRCFDTAFENQCGVIPVVDEVNSVRQLTGTGSRMVDRKQLKLVQTPQVFPAGELKKSYEAGFDPSFTDDASVAEKWGMGIQLVEGEVTNIKITTPFDMALADYYYQLMANR
ncbi:2-C-methyl-D-erythritol 4-phosphate cytidylyltransferase [Proteiniphilum saccharofermentans]|uniref:2-C-methyl-D-erythritol 4-phosphate cytidylyltransferase n=1 Tax=Proteiniphilum saccharofermentans TaxID=1642647 RepID=A0A1R3T7F7_9BACT|nr:2-C-methyl-D-erythritol 4-phosphate cytidylyltransferase [Proteiniphilum saccharofermentans]SCD22019.1 2-C-methyl-D-erythritol 4-phosphate cytidylyltransferase [Proteiniphilum saccharofermentans]